MKRTILAGAVSILAVAAASPASAAIVIGVGYNGGAVTQVSNSATGSANYNATANSIFFNSGATGSPVLSGPNLLTQSINILQAGAPGTTLNLYITQTDLAAFTGLLTSAFTSNTISNATAVISSYYSTSNALFGGTLLQSAPFNGTATFANGNLISVGGPFSTTIRYDITFGPGGGNFNGTANLLATAVPEPLTWMMMLIGFAGLGYAVRKNRNVTTRIRFA